MQNYNPAEVEKKWQKYWKDKKIFQTKEDAKKPKQYILDMFPYPSGAGLHVGHPKGYIATDVISRMKMMQGFNVLHPMGWDAFGLPAENYAIKNKVHPSVATAENIKTFKKQLGLLGFTYDWDREVNTTDPEYYKWTQWAFLEMFKRGLAYESNEPINWCPSCKTGLANEDLENGLCERCGSVVEQKPLRQWVLKITDYAERLLNDIDKLDKWPEPIKEMQRNWIGKSEGATVEFSVIATHQSAGKQSSSLEVFTTRPDTLFGATYLVIAPEHPLISNIQYPISNIKEVEEYIAKSKNKTTLERTDLAKEKTGVELKGVKAINPVNNEELPIFVADYVLGGYGTGAIMAVPAHDERDFEFAKKYNLPIKQVVAPFFTASFSKDAPRDDKVTVRRRNVFVILKHWSEDSYFCLDWEKYGWKSFVVGGVEDNETYEQGAIRELKEETGYQNIKKIEKVGGVFHDNFFAAHKDIDRYSDCECFYVELKDGECFPVAEEDTKNHKGQWVENDKVGSFVNLGNHFFCWEVFKKGEKAFVENGVAINSEFLNDLKTSEAKEKMINWLEEKNIGKRKINYKLRDWVFSRQRYWGEPIPLIRCESCTNKKYNYVIFHGLSGNSHYGFKPWLKENLEKEGHHVYSPDLPNPNEPNIDEQLKYVLDNIDFSIDQNTILVGHSLGAVIIYKLLEKIKKPVAKVVFVDPVVKSEFNDTDRPNVTKSNDWKFNWDKIKNNCKQFVVLGDRRHVIIKKEHLEELAGVLGASLNIVESNHVHFSNRKENIITEEPEVLKACRNNGWVTVPEKDLPLKLPNVESYEPSGTGESPLANIDKWVNTKCPVCGGPAKRETNTMPQWAGSCWYYLAYCMEKKGKKYNWNKDKINYWNPVDVYVGGAEHATRHLIYARFWHKFLYDIGAVDNVEPFTRLQNVGLILAEDGRKMSKRWGNVINPDDVVRDYGADAMRLYEMFMGPFDQPCAWSTQGVVGMKRFLDRVWGLANRVIPTETHEVGRVEGSLLEAQKRDSSTIARNDGVTTLLHQTIKMVSDDIENLRFNTAISKLMVLVNEMSKDTNHVTRNTYQVLLQLLSPFAPHITEELWSQLGNKTSITKSEWPKYDSELAKEDKMTIAVQVNGKLRDTLEVPAETSEEEIKKLALESEKVQKWLEGKEPKKIIYVPGKLVSVVV